MYIYKTKLTKDKFMNSSDSILKPKYLEELNTYCVSFKEKSISALKFSKFRLYDETGDRDTYARSYYGERRTRLTSFGIRVWLYHEDEDIRELEDILWAICDEYTWSLPAHLEGILTNDSISPYTIDLFAAETGQSIAEILSLCGDYIHEKVKKRCIDEVFKRIINIFEAGEIEWERCLGNWSAVCGGCVGMAALYLIEDEERLKKITDRAADSCNMFIQSCTDDGACLEGVSYWDYAMQYYTAFEELLNERTGRSIIGDIEKIKKLAEFPSLVIFENNIPVRFGDVGERPLVFGTLCKLNERFGVRIPVMQCCGELIDHRGRTCGAIRNIAWFNNSALHSNPRHDDIIFNFAQWAVLNRGDSRLVIKGGFNEEGHNHDDVGSFMYIKNGRVLCDDFGAANYSKAYWSSFNTQSISHSVPIVNNELQGHGKEFAADIFEKHGDKGIHVSFGGAYGGKTGLVSLNRYAEIEESGLKICDCFEFEADENIITERIVTKYTPKIIDNKVRLFEDNKPIAEIICPDDTSVKISDTEYEKFLGDGIQKVYMIDFSKEISGKKYETEYSIKPV